MNKYMVICPVCGDHSLEYNDVMEEFYCTGCGILIGKEDIEVKLIKNINYLLEEDM